MKYIQKEGNEMKIAIIAAMEEEVAPIRAALESPTTTTIADFEFTTGTMSGKEIVLAKSGICKVNAAISTTLVLDHFAPDFVINTGTAGGFQQVLNVGDIVVSKSVCQHDVDATGFGYEYGQIPKMETYFHADEQLIATILQIGNEEMPGKIHEGVIGTGDVFVHDAKRSNAIREKFPHLYAVEMEAGAVGQVCAQFKVPFVILRGLSDIAGKESDITFTEFLDAVTKKYTKLLGKIIERL